MEAVRMIDLFKMSNNIFIKIAYKLLVSESWQSFELLPGEYFESLCGNEVCEFQFDSVPKYFHAVEYTPYKIFDIENTRLTIVDVLKGVSFTCAETFWNGGDNRLISYRTLGFADSVDEVILETVIAKNPKKIQQIKFTVEDDIMKFQDQLILQVNKDGSQSIFADI